MSESSIKHVINELNQAFEAFKETNNQKLESLENKISDPLIDEKLSRINASLDEASQKIQKATLMAQRPSLGQNTSYDPYKKEFLDYICHGMESAHLKMEQKRMHGGIANEGGYLLPNEILATVTQQLAHLSPVRSVASVVQTNRHQYELVLDDESRDMVHWGDPNAQQRLEGTQTPRLVKRSYPTFPLFDMPRISSSLLEDTLFNIEEWLVDLITKKMARKENAAFINGDGLTRPQGILSAQQSDQEEEGRLQVLPTGRNGQFAANNPDDILVNLVHSLRPEYMQDAVWMMPRSALSEIRKMKGQDGHYLWNPDVESSRSWSHGGRILGYPVVLCDDLPALVAGTASVSVLFGSFKEGYTIVDRHDMTILRDPYSAKPDVDLLVRRRVGGGWKNYKAIKGISFAGQVNNQPI